MAEDYLRERELSWGARATGITLLWCGGLLAAGTGCGDGQPTGPQILAEHQQELDEARARWSGTGIVHYRFRYTRSCECLPEELTSPAIEVRAGAIVRVWDVATGESVPPAEYGRYFTVDGLFGVVQDGIDRRAHRIAVSYHPLLGHPTTLLVDYDSLSVDEEMAFPLIGAVQELN